MPLIETMIEELLKRLEEMDNTEDISIIHKLDNENIDLVQKFEAEYEKLDKIIILLQQAEEVLSVMRLAVDHFHTQKLAAERSWLAFWGIDQLQNDPLFEMEYDSHYRPL